MAKAAATVADIDAIGKPSLLGGFTVTADEMMKLKALSKKGVIIEDTILKFKQKLKSIEGERDEIKKQLDAEIKNRPSIKESLFIGKFIAALKRSPKRLMAVIEDIMRRPPEMKEPEKLLQGQHHSDLLQSKKCGKEREDI